MQRGVITPGGRPRELLTNEGFDLRLTLVKGRRANLAVEWRS
jgi:hypothetical protein